MRRPFGAVAVAALIGVVAVIMASSPAAAIMTGSCQAIVNGVDVAPLPVDDPAAAIHVPEGGSVTWSVSAPTAVRSRNLVMSFAGVDVTVDSGTSTGDDGGSRGDTVAIDDYAWMGAGLYQVAGVGRMADGTTCSGAVLIDVGGNPLGTAAGAVGLILVLLGSAGVIVGAIRQGGGRLVRDLIDLIELGGDDEGTATAAGAGAGGAAAGGGGRGAGAGATSEAGAGGPTGDGAGDGESGGDGTGRPGSGRGAAAGGAAAGGAAAGGAAAGGAAAGGATPAEPATTGPAEATTSPEAADVKPPPLPGMGAVAAVGAGTKALTEATEQLNGHIDDLPIDDEQKEKLKETLATGTIKEKLDAVAEVVETVEHFEQMGTETVDKMNRWGVNANGINGLLWLRTMAEASGRLGQKFTDGIVTPVIEPITEAAGHVGIEADAGEIAKAILPVQEFAEEGSKALLTGAKNVLGGDNVLDQLGQNAENDEEWRNIRTFN